MRSVCSIGAGPTAQASTGTVVLVEVPPVGRSGPWHEPDDHVVPRTTVEVPNPVVLTDATAHNYSAVTFEAVRRSEQVPGI